MEQIKPSLSHHHLITMLLMLYQIVFRLEQVLHTHFQMSQQITPFQLPLQLMKSLYLQLLLILMKPQHPQEAQSLEELKTYLVKERHKKLTNSNNSFQIQ